MIRSKCKICILAVLLLSSSHLLANNTAPPEKRTAQAWNEQGISAYRQKNYPQAITNYKQALGIKPAAYDVMNNLALALYKQGLQEESKAYSEKVIASNANTKLKAGAYFNLGMVYEKQQSLPLAAKAYIESYLLAPSESRKRAINTVTASQKATLFAKEKRRHSASESSRNTIIEYIKNNNLVLDTQTTPNVIIPYCKQIYPIIKQLQFEFVKPDIVTDDWNDITLDPFKEKYPSFVYGMGYPVGKPETSGIPRFNISLYLMGARGGSYPAFIFYGERLRTNEADPRIGSVGTPKYRVFPNNEKNRYVTISSDPWREDASPINLFSGLIFFDKSYFVIEAHDRDMFGSWHNFAIEVTRILPPEINLNKTPTERKDHRPCVFNMEKNEQ